MKAKTCIVHHSWDFSAHTRSVASTIPDYSYGGIKLDEVFASHPCNKERVRIEIPLTHPEKEIIAHDLFVGLSDSGDVGIIKGKTEDHPPMFVAFLCTDKPKEQLSGSLSKLDYSGFSKCVFKPINSAKMVFDDKSEISFKNLDSKPSKSYCL